MSIEISPKSFFQQPSVADMRLIACPGAEELTGLIDKHLVRWAKDAGIDKETFIIPCDCPASRAVMPRAWSRSPCAATISLLWWIPATTA